MNGIARTPRRLRSVTAATTMGIVSITLLSGCSLVPDLAPESLAANKSACTTVTSVWDSFTSILDPAAIADPTLLAGATITLPDLPGELQSAIDTSTDPELDKSLAGLQAQIGSVMTGGALDLGALATSGAALAARCTIFGVTPDLTIPGM